jgi:uncharacterized protein (TIGR03435 family)
MNHETLTCRLALCGLLVAPMLLTAQVPIPEGKPVDSALRFEVASIKRYEENEPTRFRMQASGTLNVTGGSLRILISNAFHVRGEHVVGLPGWADNERYSIVATAPAGASVTAIPTMLTNLLADRFQLAVHRETRETESFDLVLARDDRRLGPAVRATSVECQALLEVPPAAAAPPRSGDQAPCGSLQAGPGIARASGVTVGRLVQMLSQLTGQPVADKTGLSGLYDFTLTFNPNVRNPSVANPGATAEAGGSPVAPHLFTALLEQLGLRLASQRGTAQVVVVDRIERPTTD